MGRDRITGPCVMECPYECEVPDTVVLAQVPPPRHAWGDVVSCPNDGCDRWFLIIEHPDKPEAKYREP